MIRANEETFETIRKLDTSIHIWKFFPTPLRSRFFRAQDLVTEWEKDKNHDRYLCFIVIFFKLYDRIVEKYINQALEVKKKLQTDRVGDLSILQQFLLRGMTSKEVTTMVIDMLSAGIDTVISFSSDI